MAKVRFKYTDDQVCQVSGCAENAKVKGYCRKHYQASVRKKNMELNRKRNRNWYKERKARAVK